MRESCHAHEWVMSHYGWVISHSGEIEGGIGGDYSPTCMSLFNMTYKPLYIGIHTCPFLGWSSSIWPDPLIHDMTHSWFVFSFLFEREKLDSDLISWGKMPCLLGLFSEKSLKLCIARAWKMTDNSCYSWTQHCTHIDKDYFNRDRIIFANIHAHVHIYIHIQRRSSNILRTQSGASTMDDGTHSTHDSFYGESLVNEMLVKGIQVNDLDMCEKQQVIL